MKKIFGVVMLFLVASCSTEGVKGDKGQSLEIQGDTANVDSLGISIDSVKSEFEKDLPNGIRVVWQTKNDSNRLIKGDVVKIEYVGRTADGKIFDSSIKVRHLVPVRVGWGMLIEGWDLGLRELALNEKAKIYIPSKLAYGEKGNLREIGPNTDLNIEIEIKEKLTPIFDSAGIKVYVVEKFLEDKNPKAVISVEKIMFDYWSFTDDGKRYDSSYEKGHSFVYHIGDKNLNFGLRKGLEQLKEGESAYIHVPSQHGFGKAGLKGMVKPNQDLMFIVTIKKAD